MFSIINIRDPAEVIDGLFPGCRTTCRRLQAYHTRTQTGRSACIDYLLSEESLEVHPDDIVERQLTDGDFANLTSRRGTVKLRVRASAQSPPGTVFCSFSFNDVPVPILTGSGYDPITDTAELKVCPVRVEALDKSESEAAG